MTLWEIGPAFSPTPEQVEQAKAGFARVAKWNAAIPVGAGYRVWFALNQGVVVGSLSVQFVYPTEAGNFAEIGVNFWAGSREERIGTIATWGHILAQDYFALGCRIHPRNRAIRKVLKEFGFTHQGHDPDYDNEIWGVLTSEITWPDTMEAWQKQQLSLVQYQGRGNLSAT